MNHFTGIEVAGARSCLLTIYSRCWGSFEPYVHPSIRTFTVV